VEGAARRPRPFVDHPRAGVLEFIARFPATVELSLVAMGLALVLGVPAGIVAAVRRNTSGTTR
jgi:ABC-type dipeptide/oligopeptide/nickel transport system permease component